MRLNKALNKFAKDVIKQSRTRLTKQKINASKDLYNSLDYNLKISPNSFELSFSMEDYGKFINDGVKGAEEDRTKKPKIRLGNKKFEYKDKKPPARVFDKWQVKKGIAPRNSGGQFVSRTGLNYAIATSVFKRGIKTTEFFTIPFEQQFKKLPNEIAEAYGLDLVQLLRNTI